jgi:phosphoenolpyruvate carboxykinase (GTP)
MTSTPPDRLIDWRGAPWTPELATLPAHPNARFTASITQCPILDPAWNQPQGVPISAILLGTKRSDTMPLVFQALSWEHGVFLGAGLISETTAAAVGKTGKLRNDPFAMLPFCGYNMADYWRHWLAIGQRSPRLPPIFQVNWFRKRASGGYLWPGFGENIRVISWIFDRLSGKAHGELSPLGLLPRQGELSIAGLNVDWEELFALHRDELRTEVDLLKDFFPQFGQRLPLEIAEQLSQFEQRVTGKNSPNLSE